MRIQCPECSQRFDVTEDFLGKTVECGSCDHRFKVSESEVVKEKKKFYPGEKKGAHLERFGRNTPDTVGVDFQQVNYDQNVDAAHVGPPRPRRTVAVVCGLGLVGLVIIIFLFAGGKEGAIRDMVNVKRFILCGFAAIVGGSLIVYGMAQNRKMGLLMAAVSALLLMCMPILFPANPLKAAADDAFVIDQPTVDVPSVDGNPSSSSEQNDYLVLVGYGPVEEKIREHPKETIIAVFLRNAPPALRRSIGEFLYEQTGKISRETTYDRGENNMKGLIVLEKQTMTLDAVAALCTKFGRIEKISKDLRLIDVMVENSKITKLDQYKVLDSNSVDYETQNLNALKHIDPKVRMDAVKRLANSEPRALRDDITRQFVKMLPESGPEDQLEIIRALKVWALPGTGAEKPVLEAVQKLHQQGKVNKHAMEFLIQFNINEGGEILYALWEKDPTRWYTTMMSLGEGAQLLLLPRLGELNTLQTVAAADILGKTASKAAIPHIKEVISKKEERAQKSLQAAIDEIQNRS